MMRPLLFLAVAILSAGASAADYLVVGSRPNQLHLVDAAARQVVKSYPIPGPGVPLTVSVARDGRVAYVLTNGGESVSGIEIETGREVFRADFSHDDIRAKSMFAVTVSDDGKYLYAHLMPTRLKKSEYQVLDTIFAVYDTADGVGAKPIRTFPAPRRIALLFPGTTNDVFAAMGWDLYLIDSNNGAIVKTPPLRHWQRPGFGDPDILAFWPQFEQSRIASTPYFAPQTDVAPDSAEAFKTGIITFDLDRQTLDFAEFENASRAIFSTVISPIDRKQAYGVFNQLIHVDLEKQSVVKEVPLTQSYYTINISSDGKELYLGGTLNNIAVHDAASLEKTGEIPIPGGADLVHSSLRVIQR